jgi:hypothetical protein
MRPKKNGPGPADLVIPGAHARIDTNMCKYCVIFKPGSQGGPPDGSCPRALASLPPRHADSPTQHIKSLQSYGAILSIVFTHDGFFGISDSIALLNDSTHG